MQAQMNPGVGRGARQPGAPKGSLGRAIGYLGGHRRNVAITYGTLAIATLAQLAVPQLVQNMIDAVTAGFVPGADPALGERLVFNAALLIVAFAVIRGLFSFIQAFMSAEDLAGRGLRPPQRDLRQESSACPSATTTATRPASS